jgi:hypothetical protein
MFTLAKLSLFQGKTKMLCWKPFENSLDTKKKKFFQNTFCEKKSKKDFEKKSFEGQKNFQNFFPITFCIFEFLVQKQVAAKLTFFNNGQLWLCPQIRIILSQV